MKRYEYRIEPLPIHFGKSVQDQTLEVLNRFGREGWRLNRFEPWMWRRPALSWKRGIMLLLEREIPEEV